MSERLYTIGQAPKVESGSALLAFVLLIEPSFPSAQAFRAGVADECRKCPGIFTTDPHVSVQSDTPADSELTLLLYGRQVAIKKIGAPYPESSIDFLASRSWWWPEAAEWTAGHKEHLRISVAPEGEDPVFEAMILSVVTVAAIRLTNSAGVIWDAADRLCSSEEFETAVMECRGNDPILPVSAWVETQIGVDESDDTAMLYTTGMEALGFHEIEIQGSTLEPVDLVVMVSPLLGYIVSEAAVFEEGATIDLDDSTQAHARYGPSMLDEEREVLILDLP